MNEMIVIRHNSCPTFRGMTRIRCKQNILIIIMMIGVFLHMDTAIAKTSGKISGKFWENASPCSLQINIHNAVTGLYFGKTETDSNGNFIFPYVPPIGIVFSIRVHENGD